MLLHCQVPIKLALQLSVKASGLTAENAKGTSVLSTQELLQTKSKKKKHTANSTCSSGFSSVDEVLHIMGVDECAPRLFAICQSLCFLVQLPPVGI